MDDPNQCFKWRIQKKFWQLSKRILHEIFLKWLPEFRGFYFQIYSIKSKLFGTFNFGFPLKEKLHTVSRVKALSSAFESLTWLGHGNTFTLSWKAPIFLYKQVKWQFIVIRIWQIQCQGITGVTRGEGGGNQKLENWVEVIYGWSKISVLRYASTAQSTPILLHKIATQSFWLELYSVNSR